MTETTAAGNQGSNADWKLELLPLTPQELRNHDVVSQQQNGRGGPSMRVFENPRLSPLPEDHNPASVIVRVSMEGQPLEIVAAEIAKACHRMSIAMKCFEDPPARMQLRTPEHLRMRLTFRSDGSQLFALLDREPGQEEHDAWFSAYSTYLRKAVLSKLKESHSKPIILPKMREVYALMNSQGGFEDAVRALENFMDTSKAVDAVAVSRVVLSGKSPVETEGNDICQKISAKLMTSLDPLDPSDLGNRVLNVVVKALKISANPQALADAGVEVGCAVGGDIIEDVFASIVDRHESNPTGAALAMEGARHLAKCSDVLWRSMRSRQFR